MKKTILLILCSIFILNAFGNKNKTASAKVDNTKLDWYLGTEAVAFTTNLSISANATTICPGSGGSINLTSTPCDAGEKIQWYSGSSSVSFTSGNTGITVAPSNTNSYVARCTNSLEQVVITSNTIVIVIVSNPLSVSKNPTSNVSPGTNITLYPNGCASSNGVKWEDNSTGNPRVVSPTTTTTYSFKCTYGVCESATSKSITIVPAPAPPSISSNVASICSGGSATLTATGCDSPSYVDWILGSTSVSFATGNLPITISPTSNSAYIAKCVGSTGISDQSNVVIVDVISVNTPSSITKSPSGSVIAGTNVSLTANGCFISGSTVKWEDNSTLNPRVVTPSVNTSYSFKCVNGACESSTSANTTVNILPPAPNITTSATSICNGNSATLSSTGCTSPNVIEWFMGSASVSFTSGSTPITVSPTNFTTYTARCTGSTGTSPSSNSINISVILVNNPSGITVSPASTVGPNTNVSLTANGCGSNAIKWEDNSTANPRIVAPATTSTYSYKCVNGICESGEIGSTTVTFIPCPSTITLVNTTNDINTGPKTYQASASIGTLTASNKITGSGTNVTYNAGKSITLNNGFLADNSTIFKAEIGGCI
jgi:large repetitive protein